MDPLQVIVVLLRQGKVTLFGIFLTCITLFYIEFYNPYGFVPNYGDSKTILILIALLCSYVLLSMFCFWIVDNEILPRYQTHKKQKTEIKEKEKNSIYLSEEQQKIASFFQNRTKTPVEVYYTEIVEELSMPQPAAKRILAELTEYGLLLNMTNGTYKPTKALYKIKNVDQKILLKS